MSLFTLPKHSVALLLLFIVCSRAWAQDVNLYLVRENVEYITSNTQLIATDYTLIEPYYSTVSEQELSIIFDEESEATLGADIIKGTEVANYTFDNFNMWLETSITPSNMYVQIPMRYWFDNFSLSMTIPYLYYRSVEYSHGTVSSRGFGDMQVGGCYRYKSKKLFNELSLNAKLPTGHANQQVDGYLVPMGTGSSDFYASNTIIYKVGRSRIQANTCYRINGSVSRIVEMNYPDINETEIIEYRLSRGNTFLMSSTYRYRVAPGLSVFGGGGIIANGKSQMDKHHKWNNRASEKYLGEDAAQDFLHFDLNAGAALTILRNDLFLCFGLPIISERNPLNTEAERKLSFYFKYSRRLF